MYHNHHEDHRYNDHHSDDQHYGRADENSANYRFVEYRTATDHRHVQYGEEFVDVEQLSEERYNEELYQVERYHQEHLNEVPYYKENLHDERIYTEHDGQFGEERYGEMHSGEKHCDPEIYEYYQEPEGALFAEDFDDAQHQGRNRFAKSLGQIGFGFAIALFTIGFAAITIFASKPQMSPQEIVQMDGYKGSERDRTLFFNLASLRECSNVDDCGGVIKANLENKSTPSDPEIKITAGLRTTGQSTNRDLYPANENSNYREILAVATPATQTTANDDRKVSQWVVMQQWSIVREIPASNGAIITSLEADKLVTVVNKIGDWCEISTDSSSKPLGFMHSSLLQPIQP